jgi:hypothetical protein
MIHPALSLILFAAVTATAMSVIILTVKRIVDWFQIFSEKIAKKQNLAFTYLPPAEEAGTLAEGGRVVVVQGIFDTNSRQCREIRKIEAAGLDSRVNEIHKGNSLVVWT